MITIFTIGHSRHPIADFTALLARHGVRLLVDVRSHPASRFQPQFGRVRLKAALEEAGIEYAWRGGTLGGKPEGGLPLDKKGKPDWAARRTTPEVAAALDELARLSAEQPTAIMCAEENPAHCHRTWLVAPGVVARGVRIRHIRGDGRLEEMAPEPPAPTQGTLDL